MCMMVYVKLPHFVEIRKKIRASPLFLIIFRILDSLNKLFYFVPLAFFLVNQDWKDL